MNVSNKVVKTLNSVSNKIHDLTFDAISTKKLIDNRKLQSIQNIKKNICAVSNDLDKLYTIDSRLAESLDEIINECVVSLREFYSNVRKDLIRQNAEDDYAELHAHVHYLQDQISRIKNI